MSAQPKNDSADTGQDSPSMKDAKDAKSLAKALGLNSPMLEKGPGPQMCGDLDMRIDRNGVWYYLGTPIGRKELVKLFSSVLNRDKEGDYWLITPAEMARIQVEDAPFLAVEMSAEGEGEDAVIKFRTNIDEWVTADKDHPIEVKVDEETGEPSPYVEVRDGLKAKLARSVYYHLVERGEERKVNGKRPYGVWSSGEFFELGRLDEKD